MRAIIAKLKHLANSEEGYKLSVILAVYNNGLHLYGKAFSSLRRSSMFTEMEILLIDDGSTDGQTINYVNHLAKKYDNVRAFFFNDGGSGTPSRPRNKGVELATARYVTFLDPDNEAVDDGYAKLYEAATAYGCDLAVGNVPVFASYQGMFDNFGCFIKQCRHLSTDSDIGRDRLKLIQYEAISIQSMIIEKKLLVDNNLTQVVGAVGEDTLLSYQLMYHAKLIKAVDCNVHIYYAAVEGSTVNSIGEKYFQKVLIGKKARLEWLDKESLLQDYMDTGFNRYFSWLLHKLSVCNPAQADRCRKLLLEAFSLYSRHYNGLDEKINEFVQIGDR